MYFNVYQSRISGNCLVLPSDGGGYPSREYADDINRRMGFLPTFPRIGVARSKAR